jgi:hypothetical protein
LAGVEEKRPLRRQLEDHHFWSLIMLAVTAAAFLLVVWVATKALFVFLQESPAKTNNAVGRGCRHRDFSSDNLSEDSRPKHFVSFAQPGLFLQSIQFQNPSNFGDRFGMRETSVARRNHEF